MEAPKYLVIHHSATVDAVQKDIIERTHQRKFNDRSWYGSYILYHIMIGKDGTVIYNRGLNERTGHTKNDEINLSSIAVVLAGNFEEEEPSRQQLSSLNKVIDDMKALYDVEIIPHKEASDTLCPGYWLNQWLKQKMLRPSAPEGEVYLKRITSYNPVVEQNDASPCIGATSVDICHYRRKGIPIVALSQDLVNKQDTGYVNFGDWVQISHPTVEACNYSGVVLDVMNERYVNAADILRMDKSENHGLCTNGSITKLDKPNFYDVTPEQERNY